MKYIINHHIYIKFNQSDKSMNNGQNKVTSPLRGKSKCSEEYDCHNWEINWQKIENYPSKSYKKYNFV